MTRVTSATFGRGRRGVLERREVEGLATARAVRDLARRSSLLLRLLRACSSEERVEPIETALQT